MEKVNIIEEKFDIESFPELDREKIYREIIKYRLIEKFDSRKFVDNQKIINSFEKEIVDKTLDINKELMSHKKAEGKIYELACGLNTSSETLDSLFDEINKEKNLGWIYIHYLSALSLNPNTSPKTIEKNIDNILKFCLNRSYANQEDCDIFLSRPDLTAETIKKIVPRILPITDSVRLSQIIILIYNPNMPQDLKMELLQNKEIKEEIRNSQKNNRTKRDYLNFREDTFKLLEEKFPENK